MADPTCLDPVSITAMHLRSVFQRAALLLPLGLALPAQATSEDTRMWLQGIVEVSVGERTRLGLEVQPRVLDGGERFDQTLYRPYVSYALSDRWSVAAGYLHADIRTAAGDVIERRPWQQLSYVGRSAGGLNWTLRARLEQRDLSTQSEISHRIRLQARLTQALPQQPGWHALFSNEVFVNLNDPVWAGPQHLAQNRLLVGAMWSPVSTRRVEFGYLNQWIDNLAPRENSVNHVLYLGLYQRF